MNPPPTYSRMSVPSRLAEKRWRSLPRWFAILATIIGFLMIGHEVWENFNCPALTLANGSMVRAAYCAKLHLGTMLWGVTLMAFGLYLIQTGDVKASLDGVVASGTVVREWFRRGRATDPPGTIVQGKVVTPPDPEKKGDTTTDLSGA